MTQDSFLKLSLSSQVAIEECEDVYKEIPFLVDDEDFAERDKDDLENISAMNFPVKTGEG